MGPGGNGGRVAGVVSQSRTSLPPQRTISQRFRKDTARRGETGERIAVGGGGGGGSKYCVCVWGGGGR